MLLVFESMSLYDRWSCARNAVVACQ